MTASTAHPPSRSIPHLPEAAFSDSAAPRVASLDVLRGVVMVLMALDHVRVYFSSAAHDPCDLSQTTAALFLTRWITHFCAPAFVFLAGVGAFLHGAHVGSRGAQSRWLITRGVWLLVLEATWMRLAWTFNVDYSHYLLAGVIWAIGWSMIVLAALVHLPTIVAGAFGLLVIFGHNLTDARMATLGPALRGGPAPWLWQILYFGGPIRLGEEGPTLFVLYALIPWVGVMAAGFAFGAIMRRPTSQRTPICLLIGGGAILLFALLRGLNAYGDARPWSMQRTPLFTALSFVNTRKYPASLLFLLMTLGPMIAMLPVLERLRGPVSRWLAVFGRVPMFFYLLHVPLIHAAALVVALLMLGAIPPWLTGNHPVAAGPPPEGWGCGVAGLWAATAVIVVLLYWPCRWFGDVKRRHPGGIVSLL